MKKFSVIAVIILLSGMFFTACEKNNETVVTNDPVLERILDFKADVENPRLKSGVEIDVEDAVWVVEAALNYTYCMITTERTESGADNQIMEELFFDINISGGQISYNEAINAYLNFEHEIQNLLDEIDSETKFCKVADIEQDGDKLKATVIILYKTIETKSTKGKNDYYITDDWYWGYTTVGDGAGNCSGTVLSGDARGEIDKYVNSRVYIPNVTYDIGNQTMYYTNVHALNTPFHSGISDNPNGENLMQYGVFMFSYYTNEVIPWNELETAYCIVETNCNNYGWHSTQALGIIDEFYLEPEEDITAAFLWGDVYFTDDGNGNLTGTNLYHRYTIYAGEMHEVGTGTE